MESGLTLNYSAMDFTGFLSNVTREYTSFDETRELSNEEIARWIQIIVRPILIVFGTTGNCLSFYIMRRSSLKNVSSCFYMSVLAVADSSK